MTGLGDDLHSISEIVSALRSPPRAEELEGGEALVDAMAAAVIHDHEEPTPMPARSRSIKFGLLAGAAVLSVAGAAAAATAVLPERKPDPPVVSTTAVVDLATTAATDASPVTSADEATADASASTVAVTSGLTDAGPAAAAAADATQANGRASGAPGFPCPAGVENHGEYVSDVAHQVPPGPAHGKLVSAAAQSDCGKTDPGSASSAPTTTAQPARTGGQGGSQGNGGQGNGNGNGNGKSKGGNGGQGNGGQRGGQGKGKGG